MNAPRRTVGSHVNLGGFLRDQCGSLKEAFNLLDLRSTGQISSEPFAAGLKRLGYQGETDGVFEEMDTRGVGSITLRDFIVHFTTRIAPQQPLSRQGSARELLEDTGSTGTGMRQYAMDDSARSALVEDVEARTRDQIDALRQEVKDLVETVRLEVGSVQAQHQSQHLMLLQAMHSRPMTMDVEQLVKSEVEQSAHEVSERLEGEVSNVGRLMKSEVDQAIARAIMELEGRFGGSIFSAEANTGPGGFVSVSQLAGLESGILERVQTTMFNEFRVQFDAESVRLNSIMASTNSAVKQVSMLNESGLLSDLQTNLDMEMLKLQNRMLDTETQMMELSDDEALQKRCIPFFEDKIEAPIIAQEAMYVATEARGGIDALAKQLDKLQENVSLGNQKHEVFAERVMSGLQGLMSTIDSNSMPGLIEAPKLLQSSASSSCIMSKPSSHSSLPGMSVNDVSVTWKSLGTSVTAKPGPPVHRIHSLPLGEASPQMPPQHSRASVHGAIQALRQDLMKFHSISDLREVPGSPEKEGFADLENFALRMSCSPSVPVPMIRSRSSAHLPQPGRAASPGVPVGCVIEHCGGVVTGPLLDPRAASPTRLSMPDRLASASPGVRNRVIAPGAAAVCSVARVRSPQASSAAMTRSVTPPRFKPMVHSHSRTGLEKGRVSMAPPVAAVVARPGGSAKLPSYVSVPTQAWQQLSAIQSEQSLSRSASDQVTQASPACGQRTTTPPRKAGRQAAPAGQAAQSMRQPSFTFRT